MGLATGGRQTSTHRMTATRRHIFLIGLVIAAGVAVRVYEFGSMPPGMHQDEISAAYDGWSILHYGVDRHGLAFPVVLTSWGSGMNALQSYVAMPFLAIGGATPAAARLGQLVCCLASLLLFPLLARRLRGSWFAALSLFLAAIAPWHIMISRWALDENIFPVVFLAGVFFQVVAADRPRYLALAFLFFGLSLYTHGVAYFLVPAYVGVSSLYALAHGKYGRAATVGACAVLLVLATPIALYLIVNRWHLESIRAPWLSIPRLTGVPRYETVASVFSDPWSALGPNALAMRSFLVRQHDGNIFSAVPGYGLIYLWSMPFVVLGLVMALARVRPREYQPEVLILLWLGVGVALAVLVSANVNRMNVLLFPLLYFLAAGLEVLRTRRWIFGAIIAAYVVSFVAFTHAYFTWYQPRVAPAFFATFDRAVMTAARATGGTVCVTSDRMNMPYVYVLFHERIDPRLFARTVVYENPGAEFQGVTSFDRYVFGLERCPVERAAAVIARRDERFPAGVNDRAGWHLTPVGDFTVAIRSDR
jgi:hypothetical protein